MQSKAVLILASLLAFTCGKNALAAGCPPPYAGLIQNGAYAVAV